MPKYIYACEECEEYTEVNHRMTEKPQVMCECGIAMAKIPAPPLSLKKKISHAKAGELVKSSIAEFKKDLREQQKDASDKEL